MLANAADWRIQRNKRQAGGVPLLTGMALTRLGLPYSGHYIQVLAALAVECCITSAATIAIMKYAPFMLGKSATRHGRKA